MNSYLWEVTERSLACVKFCRKLFRPRDPFRVITKIARCMKRTPDWGWLGIRTPSLNACEGPGTVLSTYNY